MIMRFIVAPWVFFRGATEASYTDTIGIRSTAFIRCSSHKTDARLTEDEPQWENARPAPDSGCGPVMQNPEFYVHREAVCRQKEPRLGRAAKGAFGACVAIEISSWLVGLRLDGSARQRHATAVQLRLMVRMSTEFDRSWRKSQSWPSESAIETIGLAPSKHTCELTSSVSAFKNKLKCRKLI